MSGSHGTRQRAARGRGEELRSRRSSCWSLKARPSRGAALQALVRDRRFYPFSLIFRGLGGELMRQAGRSERRTAAVGCATPFPPWREEEGPEAFLSLFSAVVLAGHSFSRWRGRRLVCLGHPRTWQPWARSHPAAPVCSRDAGFQFLWVLLHLGDHRVGSWVGWSSPWPPAGDGASAPLPHGPRPSASGAAPVPSHTGCRRPSPGQSRPAVGRTRPSLLGSAVLPASQPAVPQPDPPWCLHGAR